MTIIFEKGLSEFNSRNYKKAIFYFNEVLNINPEDLNAYFNRGLARYKLNNYAGAIDDFSILIDLNPEDEEAFFHRGVAFYKLENYKQAVIDYEEAIILNPKNYHCFYQRAITQFKLYNFEEALFDCTKVMQLVPDNYHLYEKCEKLIRIIEAKIEDKKHDVEKMKRYSGSPEYQRMKKKFPELFKKENSEFQDKEWSPFEKSSIINWELCAFKRPGRKHLKKYLEKKLSQNTKLNNYFLQKINPLPNWHLKNYENFLEFANLLKYSPQRVDKGRFEELIKLLSLIQKEGIDVFITPSIYMSKIFLRDSKEFSEIGGMMNYEEKILYLNADHCNDLGDTCATITHEMIHYLQKGQPLNLEISDSTLDRMTEIYESNNDQEFRCELEAYTYMYYPNFISEYFKDKVSIEQKFLPNTRRMNTIQWICRTRMLPEYKSSSSPRQLIDFNNQTIISDTAFDTF